MLDAKWSIDKRGGSKIGDEIKRLSYLMKLRCPGIRKGKRIFKTES